MEKRTFGHNRQLGGPDFAVIAATRIRRGRLLPILLIFLVVTAGLASWMRLVRSLFPGLPATITSAHYQGVSPEKNPWLEPWQRWDTLHYQAIAERGYSAFDTAYFTTPLFPYLMRWTAPLFGGNTLVAGLFISNIAFLGCLLALYRLACFELGDEAAAMRAVVYLAFFPTAVFLTAAYNESLFLLGAILCLYYIRRRRWPVAGLMAGLTALARISGGLLCLPLAYTVWRGQREGDRRVWLSLLSMGAILISWYAYQWFILGQPPTAILIAQSRRGGHLAFVGLNLLETMRCIAGGEFVLANSLELIFTLTFLVFTLLVWRTLPRLYGIYAGSLMFFFLSRMGFPQPLVSMMRYCIEIFPAFLLMAQWGERRWVHRLILCASLFGLLFFSAQFAIWGWVG